MLVSPLMTAKKRDMARTASLLFAGLRDLPENEEKSSIARACETFGVSSVTLRRRHAALLEKFSGRGRFGGDVLLLSGRALSSRIELGKTLAKGILEQSEHEWIAEEEGLVDMIVAQIRDDLGDSRTGKFEISRMALNAFLSRAEGEDELSALAPLAEVILALPKLTAVCFGMGAEGALISEMFGLPAPLREGGLALMDTSTIALYHETLGHCTESLEIQAGAEKGFRRAALELRADIAALAGSCRDEGESRMAKVLIAGRDLAALRKTFLEHENEFDFDVAPAVYAHGHILRNVLAEIEAEGDDFARKTDGELLEFVNASWARNLPTEDEYARRCDVIRHAVVLAVDAMNEGGRMGPCLAELNPDLHAEALHCLDEAMESLRFLCEVAPQSPSPRARSGKLPSPAPAMR